LTRKLLLITVFLALATWAQGDVVSTIGAAGTDTIMLWIDDLNSSFTGANCLRVDGNGGNLGCADVRTRVTQPTITTAIHMDVWVRQSADPLAGCDFEIQSSDGAVTADVVITVGDTAVVGNCMLTLAGDSCRAIYSGANATIAAGGFFQVLLTDNDPAGSGAASCATTAPDIYWRLYGDAN